jgi:hypothetical protein
VARLHVDESTAANTLLRTQKEGVERSRRRHRRYGWTTGLTRSGWRVSTW